MRILRIADIPENPESGMGGYLAQTTVELRSKGHDVDHLWMTDLALSTRGRSRRLLAPLAVVASVRKRMSQGMPPDVVEVHEPLGAAYGLAGKVARFPPFVALSYGLEVRSWSAFLERSRIRGTPVSLKSRVSVPATLLSQARIVYRTADAIAVPSTADRDWLIAGGVAPERVVFAPTGVSEDLLTSPPPGRAGEDFTALFIGSWIDRKGIPELIDAWSHVLAAVPDARLVVAGTGVAAPQILDQFGDARDSVEVIDRMSVAGVREVLGRVDVFVLPSWFEGLPLSALEAAASGLPCVLSAVCGNLDFARPEDSQADGVLLVPPHDAHALATALTRLAASPALRATLGNNARNRARLFTWTRSAEALERAYRVAVGPSGMAA